MKIIFEKEMIKACGNCLKQNSCTYPINHYCDNCNPKWKARPEFHKITGAAIIVKNITVTLTEKELRQLQCGLFDGDLTTMKPTDLRWSL